MSALDTEWFDAPLYLDVTSNQPPIISLLTDFGYSDVYAGVLKGVILSIAPGARIVDLTHAVRPQDVLQGAFLLETARRYFPRGTVHLAVVDPGVGTFRRRIAVRAEGQTFVGPDNGLLSSALPDEARGPRSSGENYRSRRVALPPGIDAVELDAEALGRAPSATFEGRDVFAPAAARLAAGAALSDLGTALIDIEVFPAFGAPRGEGSIEGYVLHIDTYGNLITDIRANDLPANPRIEVAGRELRLAHTFATAPGLSAIVGSSGYVEVALANGNAAAELSLSLGDVIRAAS
jgi:S-adenosylmethionine hydrolase